MRWQLVKLSSLSGKRATVYVVRENGNNESLFDAFLSEFSSTHKGELMELLDKLKTMGHKTGAKQHFFKTNQGALGDGCCYIRFKKNQELRLYCIRFGTQLVVVCGGGHKQVRAWQDDPKLSAIMTSVKELFAQITQRITEKEIAYTASGLEFVGNLEFDIEP